jgi:hypothetical protein
MKSLSLHLKSIEWRKTLVRPPRVCCVTGRSRPRPLQQPPPLPFAPPRPARLLQQPLPPPFAPPRPARLLHPAAAPIRSTTPVNEPARLDPDLQCQDPSLSIPPSAYLRDGREQLLERDSATAGCRGGVIGEEGRIRCGALPAT